MRAAVVGADALLITILAGTRSSAHTTQVSVWRNGETKATATFNNNIDENSYHSQYGNPGCIWLNNVVQG